MILYFFVLFLFVEKYFSRTFRFMDPTTMKFIGFTKKAVRLTNLSKSAFFNDEKAYGRKNFVRMIIGDDEDGDFLSVFIKKKDNSFVFPMMEGMNRFWQARHFGRDLVTIRPYLNTKNCLTYNRSRSKFQIKRCRPAKIFKDQKFLVTSKAGVWKGTTTDGYYFGDPNDDILWGTCPTCIPGGFGSEDQGKAQDILRKVFEENPELYEEYYS